MRLRSLSFHKVAFFAAGVLLFASVTVPYLAMIFTSPQYPDSSPVVLLYTDRLGGDVHEWQVVARYIGVKVPPDLPEFDMKIITALVVLLSLVTFAAGFMAARWKQVIVALLLVAGVALAGWAQYRLYQAGHNLDPKAPMRYAVKPFTPPLVGIVRVHKITIYHVPHAGFLFFGGAVVLTLFAVRRRNVLSGDAQAQE